MALTAGVLWQENAGAVHKAHSYRQLLAALTGHRTGVLGVGDLRVTQRGAGANMSVDVSFGDAIVMATIADVDGNYGAYYVRNGATVNLPIGAADATNARFDDVVIDIRDSELSGATNDVRLRVLQGTPSGSPAEPALPANRIDLARITVAAGATSILDANITNLHGDNRNPNQTGQLILPSGIPDQTFDDTISGGTATSLTAYGTHNNVGTAPYDLTMIVEVMGEWGNSTAGSTTKSLQVWDEAGANITAGVNTSLTWDSALASQVTPLAARGIKNYSAGDTMGFRLAYMNSSSNLSIFANARVSFIPKVNT